MNIRKSKIKNILIPSRTSGENCSAKKLQRKRWRVFFLPSISALINLTHSWQLTSPSWRVDLEQEVDAIEEIARDNRI